MNSKMPSAKASGPPEANRNALNDRRKRRREPDEGQRINQRNYKKQKSSNFSKNQASGRSLMAQRIGDDKHETHQYKNTAQNFVQVVIGSSHASASPAPSTTHQVLDATRRSPRSPADSGVGLEDADEIQSLNPRQTNKLVLPIPRPSGYLSPNEVPINRIGRSSPRHEYTNQKSYDSEEFRRITDCFTHIKSISTYAEEKLKSTRFDWEPFEARINKLKRWFRRLSAAQEFCPDDNEFNDYSCNSINRHHRRREKEEWIKNIFQVIDSAKRGSEELYDQVDQMCRLMGSAPKDRHYVMSLNDEIERCIKTTTNIVDKLSSFREKFDCLSGMKRSHRPIPDHEAVEKIERFKISRDYSLVLCQNLSEICHIHKAHDMYFNLDSEHDVYQKLEGGTPREIEFRLAVQRTDMPRYSPVWLKAKSMISIPLGLESPVEDARLSPLQVGESLVKAKQFIKGARFCLGELHSGMDFRFQVGKFDIQHPDPRVRQECRPVTLSEWIETRSGTYPRIRLARLIAEAILKFDPVLWRWTDLDADSLLIIPPLEYEHIESHIGVSTNHQASRPKRIRAGEIFVRLGVTFLELAYQERLPRPRSSNGVPDESCPILKKILKMASDEKLQDKMGDKYADAVRFCLSWRTLKTDLCDHQVQMDLYQKVIGVLRHEEEYQADSFEELRKIAGEGGTS
ncbi:hypothetical protein F4679DRAFT_548973 [Xylaria curta]|nr:hypothetical protein F4679DRAFT_548973 [Xylaria curta]